MHPGDREHQDRRREPAYYEHADRQRGDAPSASWKGYGHIVQHLHAPMPLPLPASSPPLNSIHSIHYDRRRAERFPYEHKATSPPPPPPPPPLSQHFAIDARRRDHIGYSTVFPANPFRQDRWQHFQRHSQHRAESPPAKLRRDHAADSKQSSPPPRGGKGSLAFILGDHVDPEEKDHCIDHTQPPLGQLRLHDTSSRDGNDDGDGDSSDTSLERYASRSHSSSERRSPPPRKGSVKKSRICKVDNCTRYVVNKGLCIGHGGGKRCAVAGCTSSAKNMGVCWKHGGSTKCTVENCENRAKSRGVCWSHGGGRKCKEDGCAKTAVSNGLCWAHGGGKRCVVEGCKKPAYERNGNLCTLHKGGTHA